MDYFSGTEFVGKTRSGRYETFYINYWKPMRRIKPEQWKLEVRGLCQNPVTFTLEDIKSLPVKTRTSRLKCVECWSSRAEWQGFSIGDLEEKIQPLPEATGVLFHCADSTHFVARGRNDFKKKFSCPLVGSDVGYLGRNVCPALNRKGGHGLFFRHGIRR